MNIELNELGEPISVSLINNKGVISKVDIIYFKKLLDENNMMMKDLAKLLDVKLATLTYIKKSLKLGPKKYPFKNITLTPDQKSVLVGTVLGDGSLTIPRKGSNANLSFSHCVKQKEFFDYKVNFFVDFGFYSKPKKLHADSRTGKYYLCWDFKSNAHPIFTEYQNLFYHNKIKKVPENIEDYLTPLALAIWFMDDGSSQKSGYIISTNSFSVEEVNLLINILYSKFNVVANLHHKEQPVIYITAKSKKLFRSIIEPYIIESMNYKLL